MKVLVLYRPTSEYARAVEDFVKEYRSRGTEQRLEVMSIDSRDGGALASLYDVFEYPAVIVLRSDGSLQKSWVGPVLPRIDEVIAYARS